MARVTDFGDSQFYQKQEMEEHVIPICKNILAGHQIPVLVLRNGLHGHLVVHPVGLEQDQEIKQLSR